MSEDKIVGKVGFEDNRDSDVLTKEETMFKIDNDGEAIAEKVNVYIYDRDIDNELFEESTLLMNTIKRHKAINKIMVELNQQQDKETNDLKSKIEKETDVKAKLMLQNELKKRENIKLSEEVQSKINANVVQESIKESREIIQELKDIKKSQTQVRSVELKPCTVGEAHYAFKQGKTIKGKDTNDWIADLISNKLVNPAYNLEDAKRLKPDFKIAIKDAILESSGYKLTSYRDIMMQRKLEEEKPKLALKKDKTS